MNADEAEKCLEKALQYFKSGDFPNVNFSKLPLFNECVGS